MQGKFYLTQDEVERYAGEKRKGLKKFKQNEVSFAKAILNYITARSYIEYQELEMLCTYFAQKNTRRVADGFTKKEFKVLEYLLGAARAKIYLKIWLRSTDYIYMTGYDRRSFRTKDYSYQYFEKNLMKLKALTILNPDENSLDKFFESTESNISNSVIPDLIAIAVDEGDKKTIEKIRRIIYENAGVLRREIICGLLMSHSSEAYKMVADLLVAAKLQEGLRQSVFETMDEGASEGFLYILKTAIDNNMLRFSSFKRAVATWTGLMILAEDDKIACKCVSLIYGCLTDKAEQQRCLQSNDAVEIYISLWAHAFEETSSILECKKELTSGESYKKLCLLYFSANTHFSILQDNLASELLEKEHDSEILGWATINLFQGKRLYEVSLDCRQYALRNLMSVKCKDPDTLFKSLLSFLSEMQKNELRFEKSIFPWQTITVNKAVILEKMFICAYLQLDRQTDIFIQYRDSMNIGTRCHLLVFLLNRPKNRIEKEWVLSFLADKSSNVRRQAMAIVDELELNVKDLELIEGYLKYKNGELRKACIKLLLKQDEEDLKETISRLLASDREEQRLAGLEIISSSKNNIGFLQFADTSLSQLSTKVSIYTEKLKRVSAPIKADGFGLFDPSQTYKAVLPDLPKEYKPVNLFIKSVQQHRSYIDRLKSLIDQHRGFEYEAEWFNGQRQKVIFGANNWLMPFKSNLGKAKKLEDYPFGDIWRTFLNESGLTPELVIGLLYCIERRTTDYQEYEKWFLTIEEEYYPKDIRLLDTIINRSGYRHYIEAIFQAFVLEFKEEVCFEISKNALLYILNKLPEYHLKSKLVEERGYYGHDIRVPSAHFIKFWVTSLKQSVYDDDSFLSYFAIAHFLYERSDFYDTAELSLDDYARALKLNQITEDEVICELMSRPRSKDRVRELTNERFARKSRDFFDEEFISLAKKAVDRILDIEIMRGDLNTEVTELACNIQRCSGAKYFVGLLRAMGNEPFNRGYDYVVDSQSRGAVLSHLIHNCYPEKGEDETILNEYLKESSISEKRLLEAAMYAPQWIDIVEKYLKWDGLASACWYFHAHLNEVFSKEKIPIIARYSPLEPMQLYDGSFDIDWFWEAFNTLKEEKFNLVYNAAKYISRGAKHRRSQLFADAVLGRLDMGDLQKRIKDSRNKDYLLAYSIIPIKGDIMLRYDFLQNFKKESTKFGAQRKASESRAVEIAMENLARNAGYSNVSRLIWNIETTKAEELTPLFKPQIFEGGIETFIEIEETGKSKLEMFKNGKKLSGVPTSLKNNDLINQMKEAVKTLQQQFRRAKEILESAMESSDEFLVEELERFSQSPVLSRLIQHLVFVCDQGIGFFINGALCMPDGEVIKLKEDTRCLIAHPVDLFRLDRWADFQKYLFDKQIVQPFKQVFRELYTPNEDELSENIISRRYAGYQIQPHKAVALLKTRGWTAGYEEGVQKIYYKENIAVQLYGAIDWFSPADIEAPALEGLAFFDRRTYKPIPISDVPKKVFSEVMRDVDMVVSVAHAGGVDPEASLSTVEMRFAIIKEIIRLMRFKNVLLKGSHAVIDGKYGQYTVHLGSGIVHKMAHGAVYIIPVHSQHRGRIFLPFIDDDPRTAEITTKILFLAEDHKIKDPSILNQIVEDTAVKS